VCLLTGSHRCCSCSLVFSQGFPSLLGGKHALLPPTEHVLVVFWFVCSLPGVSSTS
jgi:hypothetical protein